MFSKQSRNVNLEWQFVFISFRMMKERQIPFCYSIFRSIPILGYKRIEWNRWNWSGVFGRHFGQSSCNTKVQSEYQSYRRINFFPREKAKSLAFPELQAIERKTQPDSWSLAVFHKATCVNGFGKKCAKTSLWFYFHWTALILEWE